MALDCILHKRIHTSKFFLQENTQEFKRAIDKDRVLDWIGIITDPGTADLHFSATKIYMEHARICTISSTFVNNNIPSYMIQAVGDHQNGAVAESREKSCDRAVRLTRL